MGAEMKLLKGVLYLLLASVFGLGFVSLYAANQPKLVERKIAEVSPSNLPEGGKDSHILAFDVAPDGNLLAVLYMTWPSRTSYELSIAIWDIRSKTVVQHTNIGLPNILSTSTLAIDNEVIFTADNKYLLVLGPGKVWILDTSTCAVVRSIDPPRPELGLPVHIEKVGHSSLSVTYKQGYDQFYIALFEVPTARMIAGWSSSSSVQSFSPDGTMAVGPDVKNYNVNGVMNLLLLDANTGVKIKSIPVGFGFKKWESGEEKGSFTARFMDNKQIVVTPDNMVDHTGHHSGNSLEVFSVNENRVVHEIVPKNFGPTGELAVSSDLSHYVVYSHYVSASAKLSDGFWPDFHKPELFIFSVNNTQPDLVIPNLDGDGAMAYLRNMILPKLSSDASVVAIAQHGAVIVFQREEM